MRLFQSQVIRCQLEPFSIGKQMTTVETGKPPGMYVGAEVRFEFALFRALAVGSDEAELLDISNLSTVILQVRQATAAGSLLMDSSVSGTVEINPACTLAEWEAGTGCHIRIYFPAGSTAIAAGTHHILLRGVTNESAGPDVLGYSASFLAIDVGIGTASSAPIPAANYPTWPEVQALIANCVKFGYAGAGKSISLVSPDGTKAVTLGVDDNGDLLTERETL